MTSIQQWGNKRSNLYWEAHLKPGHIPPEHKVESFIRSKYEVRRWAKDGPVPSDPSTLEVGGSTTTAASAASSSAAPVATPTASSKSRVPVASAIDLLGGDIGPGSATTSVSEPRKSVSLLDSPPPSSTISSTAPAAASSIARSTVPAPAASKAEKTSGGGGGLFDLDWHSGPTSPSDSSAPSAKGNKKDILSLYSNTSPPRQTSSSAGLDAFGSLKMGTQQSSGIGSAATASNPWGAAPMQQQAPNTNRGSTGMFSSQDVWGSPTTSTTTSAPSLGGNDLWGEMTSGNHTSTTTTTMNSVRKTSQASQNDAFADIWK